MALPDFDYLIPRTLGEAIELLSSRQDAKLLAGGQSLIPLLSMRLARPSALIDIGRLAELRGIREADGHLVIGALTTHREVESSPVVRRGHPVVAEAAGMIGHSHIRNRGTIGGSVAHADPAAEYPVVCMLTDARIVLTGPAGERRVDAIDFFLAPLTTAIGADEILTAVEIPYPPAGTGAAFRELVQRSGDFAVVAVGALVTPGLGGTVAAARIAIGGANPVPMRASAAEAAAEGRPAGPELWAELGRLAAKDIQPESDIHASAEYRRAVAAVYVRDTLAEAFARAGGDHAR